MDALQRAQVLQENNPVFKSDEATEGGAYGNESTTVQYNDLHLLGTTARYGAQSQNQFFILPEFQ